MRQSLDRQPNPARDRWLRRLLWAAFAFAIVTCYSAQVAHFYTGGHGARQCERCQNDLHVDSEPLALRYAPPAFALPQPHVPVFYPSISPPQDQRGIRPHGRAPPPLAS